MIPLFSERVVPYNGFKPFIFKNKMVAFGADYISPGFENIWKLIG